MKNISIPEWIALFIAGEPPRSKSLIMTIFGDAIVPHGGVAWLGSLIDLLAPFGVNDRLLRTSVFRLAQEGWLVAQRDGRRSAYAITAQAQARFAHAYQRIYAPLSTHWDGSWTLVLNPGGGSDAVARGALRKELLWEGYSMIAPGLFAHPASNPRVLDALLARSGLAGQVYVCHATELPGASQKPLRGLVDDGWDLGPVAAGYQAFIARFTPLLALLQGGGNPAPEQAFVLRTLLIHAYRRVQLHDPQLPVELLPEPWPGSAAYTLASAVYCASFAAAEQHLMTTLQRADPHAAGADASFYQRFGGLA